MPSVLVWPTPWGWKEFHHQSPIPNPPGSLRGHPVFLLSEPPLESHLLLLTCHAWCWESQSHMFQWLELPRYRTVTWRTTLPWAFDNTTKAALYVVSVTHARSFGRYSGQTLWWCWVKAFLFSWGQDWALGEEMGRASLPLLCLPIALPVVSAFPSSLCLSFPWSVKQKKRFESWSSHGKAWRDHMGHSF